MKIRQLYGIRYYYSMSFGEAYFHNQIRQIYGIRHYYSMSFGLFSQPDCIVRLFYTLPFLQNDILFLNMTDIKILIVSSPKPKQVIYLLQGFFPQKVHPDGDK